MRSLQPHSRDCFVCGSANSDGLRIRFVNIGPGEVESRYTVDERYQGYPGIVHGGIVAAMLDEISYRSLIVDQPKAMMYTARLDIRYRSHVPVNEPLRLHGVAGRRKSRTASAKGYIYSEDGELLAEAEALLVRVPDEVLADENLNELGWKVYSDEEFNMLGGEGSP